MKNVIVFMIFGILCMAVGFGVRVAMTSGGNGEDYYDPNDTIYKFIPPAPVEWRKTFGNNERTRVLYRVSELSVALNTQSQKIIALEKMLDPNNVKSVKDVNGVKK